MHISPYDVMRVTDRRAKEAERRAQIRRLIQEAADGGSWMPRRVSLLLRRTGRLLVAAGRRLQRIGAPRPTPGDGRVHARSYRHILSGPRR